MRVRFSSPALRTDHVEPPHSQAVAIAFAAAHHRSVRRFTCPFESQRTTPNHREQEQDQVRGSISYDTGLTPRYAAALRVPRRLLIEGETQQHPGLVVRRRHRCRDCGAAGADSPFGDRCRPLPYRSAARPPCSSVASTARPALTGSGDPIRNRDRGGGVGRRGRRTPREPCPRARRRPTMDATAVSTRGRGWRVRQPQSGDGRARTSTSGICDRRPRREQRARSRLPRRSSAASAGPAAGGGPRRGRPPTW
jgi:hypothetical protein